MPQTRRAILTHGFASSWAHGWEQHGWPDLLAEAHVDTVPFALPGHVDSPLPPMPLSPRCAPRRCMRRTAPTSPSASRSAPPSPCTSRPARPTVSRRSCSSDSATAHGRDPVRTNTSQTALTDPASDDASLALLRRAAQTSGNDLSRYRDLPPRLPRTAGPAHPALHLRRRADRAGLEDDELGPATMAATSMTNTRLQVLPGVDHWRTPSSPAAMTAVLDFLS